MTRRIVVCLIGLMALERAFLRGGVRAESAAPRTERPAQAAASPPPAGQNPPGPPPVAEAETTLPVPELLRRTGRYVQDFEQAFSMVISDETYEQHDERTGRSRELQSETLFLWVPPEATWLAVRNVRTVSDGSKTRRIRDSERRLERVLKDSSLRQVRRLADEGARFNLGRITRNVNDPTLVLRFLDPARQSHFGFRLNEPDTESVDGVVARVVAFAERRGSPLIASDGAARATGVVWLDPANGAVLRTRLTLEPGDLTAAITVDYTRDPKLVMRVPTRMEESYRQADPFESIVCVARYSNYRRFETSGRMIDGLP